MTGADVDRVVPARWAFWRGGRASGVRNMAVDAALLRQATGRATRAADTESAQGVWRCYQWTRPTVSFGRNETTRGRFDEHSVRDAGLDAVRRPTGGRALLHSREVTYSIAMPLADALSWRVAYDAVNRLIVSSLRAAGFSVDVVPDRGGSEADALRPNGPLCFDAPSPGEITARGLKLVASAVWRERDAYLQHGSILLHDDQALLASASAGRVPPPPPAASLATLAAPRLGDVGRDERMTRDDEIRHAVVAAMERELAAISVVTPFTAEASMSADIDEFEEQFASRDWLWRR